MACCTVLMAQVPLAVLSSRLSSSMGSKSAVGFACDTTGKGEAPVAQMPFANLDRTRLVAKRSSRSFPGRAGLFGPQQTTTHCLPTSGRGTSKIVCLFGRGRKRTPEYEAYEEPSEIRRQPSVVERRDEEFYTPLVEQAVQFPTNYMLQYPSAAAVVAAVVCAGFVVLAVKVVNHLRGGVLQAAFSKRQQKAFVGPEEEAALLLNARAKLAKAFGDTDQGGEVTRLEVASMMDSAADYLYALAHEVVEMKAVLSDREERLALAVERSKQDADERKELIRRISMAEAELVEEQLQQAADKAAATAREQDLEEEKGAEIERLISMHQADLDGLHSQFERQEKEAESVAAVVQRLAEEVKALKQSLKEREVQLAAAEKKAREDSALNASLSAHLDSANSKLESALAREDQLKSSLEESVSGVAGAEQRLEEMQESAEQELEEMQHRHETELRAVRGIGMAQAQGLEDRLKSAQEKAEEAQAEKDAETTAREAAEAAVEDLQEQVDQLERDLIFLEAKYKQGVAKANAAAPAEAALASQLEKVKEALESKTQQAQAAKELVLQFMENEREKDFELKQLKREVDLANERLAEVEQELDATVAARIGDALDGPKGGRPKRDSGERARERSRFEKQIEGLREDSEREIAALRAELKGAKSQLARVQKQSSVEVEAKLAKQEMDLRMKISERESERDGCLVRVGSLEEELEREIMAREMAGRELSNANDQLLEWEQRAMELETAHAAALETERETSRQKLEALYLDYEKVRDEAQEKEKERVSLAQQTEQLQAALAEATSKGKLQAAKENETQTALALNQDMVDGAQATESRYEAELEALANDYATRIEALEDAQAVDAAAAREEQERLEGEIADLRKQVQALEEAVETRERDNEKVRAQVAQLETANASAKQRLEEVDARLQQQHGADNDIAVDHDVIRGLESERAAAAAEALQRLEEADVLRTRVSELQEAQEAALEDFRAEAAAGDEELTRVRQRLADVERALEGSQNELRGAKLEEERLSSQLTSAQAASAAEQEEFREKVEGLERALEESGTELQQSEEKQHELQQGLSEDVQSRGEALRELQERESATLFFQRYFEERSGLDVQLLDLGRLSARLEAAKRDPSSAGLDGPEEVSSLQAEFSHLLKRFEDAVSDTAATFGRPSVNGVDLSGKGLESSQKLNGKALTRTSVRGNGSGHGTPVPRALDLVGVDEAAGTALGNLNGRLSSAERKADELHLEIRQRVVRQLEWQSDSEGEAEFDRHGATRGDGPQSEEVQERVSQMVKSFAQQEQDGQ